jgi:membrane associated rhomboid family serine protease
MELGSWVGLLAGVSGAAVAIYGAIILLTGRATRGDRRAFRRLKDAGLCYLGFGLALALLMLGVLLNEHRQALPAVVALIGTMLAGLAGFRYRPRQDKRR